MPRHAWIARLSPRAQTAVLCATLSLGYCTTYLFTRPYFVLPDGYLNSTAGGLHGSQIDRQSALALAQSLGYLFSKWPAVVLMSSAAFFRHRQRTLAALFGVTAVVSGVGFAVFDASPVAQSVCVGLSSVTVGMVYGGMVSYAEGRGSTEIVVACLNLSLVLAGGIARFLGTALVNIGIAPRYVPGVASILGLVVGLLLLDVLAHLPAPSQQDQRERGKRRAMNSEERAAFLRLYAPGIAVSLVAYSAVMTIRSFRDYFALQLYTEANRGVLPAPSTYFWADFPGALTVCFSLALLSKVKSNRTAVFVMVSSMIAGVGILGGGTLLYRNEMLGGIAWQVVCGVGIYSAYLVMGTAFLDRLLAASGSEGTIVFLQFISDGSGWLGTVFILFWKNLSADKSMPVSDLFAQICLWASIIMVILLVLMNVYFMCVLPKGTHVLMVARDNQRKPSDGVDKVANDMLRLNSGGIDVAATQDVSNDGNICDSVPLLGAVA